MRLLILGPLEVRCGGRQVSVTAAKQQAILAMLAANVGRVVRVESLVTEVWGPDPPKSAVANLRTYVMQLRKLLPADDGTEYLVTTQAGYQLRVDPADIDLHQFESALERAHKAMADVDLSTAESALDEALALWRGEVVENVELGPALRNVAARVDELHATALEDYAEVKLALGDHAAAVDRLRDLLERYPLRERAYGQLMLALYQRGDVDGAISVHDEATRILADELGIEPGPELSSLYQAILRRDPALTPEEPEAAASPHELPRNPMIFVGRTAELADICDTLRDTEAATRIVVIHGPGGIGKSALAVRAAYTVANEFPDGQLYVDLQGSTPGLARLEPAEVLARFLRAFGVPQAELPATQAESVTRFQSILAGRRVLLVLDNAPSAAHVTPLLPAGDGCAVIVTARAALPTVDAKPVGLRVLDEADAINLLTLTAGPQRVTAEPGLAAQVVRQCGRHPLALRIVAARLASRPDWSLARLEARLSDQRRRLHELRIDDLDLRSCFAVSYEALTAGTHLAAARTFRLLGTLDVPEFGVGLVAALTGVDPLAAEDALDELIAVRLVDVVAEGRFKIHDLLRLYAAELAEEDFPPAERKQALDRALDWYLQSCRAVVGTADLPWFETELPCLVSAAIQASAAGSRFVVDLLTLVKPLALKRGCWHELEVLSRLALDVGARLDDLPGQSLAIATLATVDWRAGRTDAAMTGLQRGLELARAAGALDYEIRAQHNLGWLAMRLGDNQSALEHMTTAVELLGDRQDHAIIGFLRHNQAEVLLRLGRSQQALDCFGLSLAARRARGDRIGESVTLAGLGRAYCLLDWQDQAMSTLEAAALCCQEVGNQEDEWEVLLCRSEICLRRDCPADALADLDRAAALAATVDDKYGQAVIARQLARTLAAHGDHTGAMSARRRAEKLFAAPGIHRDPVLEKLLTIQCFCLPTAP